MGESAALFRAAPGAILRFFFDVLNKCGCFGVCPTQKEFSIHDLPLFGVHTGKLAGIEAHRSKSAVARRIFHRIGCKQVTMLGIDKAPLRIVPVVGECITAFQGLTSRKVGHRIIAVDRNA